MRIEVFSGPSCSQCEAAKRLLAQRGLDYIEIDVSTPSGMAQFRERLPRMKAVPQVFVDGEHIGALEDLRVRWG